MFEHIQVLTVTRCEHNADSYSLNLRLPRDIASARYSVFAPSQRPLPNALANRTYRHLLLAQIVAFVGTGMAEVASGLPAFDFTSSEINEALVCPLHRRDFMDSAGKGMLIDGQGNSKSHVAGALGLQVGKHHRRKVCFVATVDLVKAMEQENAANTAGQFAESLPSALYWRTQIQQRRYPNLDHARYWQRINCPPLGALLGANPQAWRTLRLCSTLYTLCLCSKATALPEWPLLTRCSHDLLEDFIWLPNII